VFRSPNTILQGVCDMGMLPDRLPGYQPVTDSKARAALEAVWAAASRDARRRSRHVIHGRRAHAAQGALAGAI